MDKGELEFSLVLEKVKSFVFHEKGNIKHGNNKPLLEQDWKYITDNVGLGFTLGQALKKILELKNTSIVEKWNDEIIGAISYLIFAYMAKNEVKINTTEEKETDSFMLPDISPLLIADPFVKIDPIKHKDNSSKEIDSSEAIEELTVFFEEHEDGC